MLLSGIAFQPDTDIKGALSSAGLPLAPTDGGESSISPKKKARTVLVSVDGSDPAEIKASIEPDKGICSGVCMVMGICRKIFGVDSSVWVVGAWMKG